MDPSRIDPVNDGGVSCFQANVLAGSTQGRFISSGRSPSILEQIMANLNIHQKKLAEKAGLGFLSNTPLRYKPSNVLAAWLLSSIDCSRSVICIPSGAEIKISAQAASSLLGLPIGTITDNGSTRINSVAQMKSLARDMSVGYLKSSISISRAKAVLLSLHYVEYLSEEEGRTFLIALIIYTLSTFISPVAISSSEHVVDPAIISAILQPPSNELFDWAGYTVAKLLDAALSVQQQLKQKNDGNPIYLNGCLILLNVSTRSAHMLPISCSFK